MTKSNENELYKTYKALATSVKVVNNVAESWVTLKKEYNKLYAKDEE